VKSKPFCCFIKTFRVICQIVIFGIQKNKAMNIQAEIKWIQTELTKVNDPTLIEIFVKLLKNRQSAIESNLDEYNKELDEANSRIEAGKFITQEDLEKEASQW
jgi:hypothetical protein